MLHMKGQTEEPHPGHRDLEGKEGSGTESARTLPSFKTPGFQAERSHQKLASAVLYPLVSDPSCAGFWQQGRGDKDLKNYKQRHLRVSPGMASPATA